MYRGRYQLGEILALCCLTVDGSKTPGAPTQAPVAIVMADSAQLFTMRLPVHDRFGQTGYFQHPLLIDGRFSAGDYRVIYQWVIGSTAYSSQDDFTVVAGGNTDGPVLGLFYFRRPGADYLLQHVDSGRLIRKRNPRV